ncbi:MAG: ATP-binding protein [Firmicutes bacterium]|nr:ATP-binding protein [Bacillota bacterium]
MQIIDQSRATGPARLTGQTSRTLSEGRCGIDHSCMVEITGNQQYCADPERDCPVKKHALYKKLERCGIHRRFRDCTFENIEKVGVPESVREQYGQVKEYAVNLKENIAEGRGLLLKGSVGTMKTTLAVAVLQEHIARGGSGLFITMSSLLDNIFTLKARNPEEWANFEQRVRETPLLVLDDLGAEYTEGWVLTKVDAIISERYNRCRSVIVTTNLTAEQLRGVYAERVIDRLRSTLKVVNFSGRSLRVPA